MADALSRRADDIPEPDSVQSECVVNAITTVAVQSTFLQDVIKSYSHGPIYSPEDAARPPRTVRESNGTWCCTDSTQLKRMCITDSQKIREKLLRWLRHMTHNCLAIYE